MVSGVTFAIVIDLFTGINFAYVGFFSFVFTIIVALVLSRFEAPVDSEKLANLTIYTLSDARGPWVGLKSWPNLWKWALFLAFLWIGFSVVWEWYFMMR